jgi:5-methylthioadenosine/S-adenosylhomocysteine deaminase
MSILIKNCDWIITEDARRSVLKGKSVYIQDGLIAEIGDGIHCEADYVIDGSRKLMMPGLINAHTHLAMTLFRGYADDMPVKEWLERKIWPLEAWLDEGDCFAGSMLGCLEMIETGTTCFLDMYFFNRATADAVERSGLRAILSYAIIDAFDPESKGAPDIGQKLASFRRASGSRRVEYAIGPHAPYSCSDETLLKCKERAIEEGALIHTHLAEAEWEQRMFREKYGKGVVEHLEEIGFLCENLVAAHCVWLDEGDIALMSKRGAKAALCPVSNMKLAVGGVAPATRMLAGGLTIALGTDGAASNNSLDMFGAMKICALANKLVERDPTALPANVALDMATIGGARALGKEGEIGSIEVGKRADLILLDLRSPNLRPIHGKDTVVSDVVYSASGYNVDTTIVDGKPLMLNRRLLTLDKEEVLERAEEAAIRLIERGRRSA